MFEILARIPLYVWPLFVFLIWAGRRESRTHLVRPWQVVLPAAIMSLYGLYGTGDTYGWSGFALGAWGAGALAGLVLLSPAGAATRAARRNPEDGRYLVPGSYWPLGLFMTVFGVRFALGMSGALAPALLARPAVMAVSSAILGACAGAMMRRLLDFRAARRSVAAA